MGLGHVLLLTVLYVLSFVYDMITLPFYAFYQRPWAKLRKSKESKAHFLVGEDGQSITYSSSDPMSELRVELKRANCDTLDAMFEYSIAKFGDKKCLGTRQIIAEEDEKQPNGRLFKKYVLGDYQWKSYNDVKQVAADFSKGLLELGLKPKDTVAIFAETREEWFISAMAAFKQNLTLTTLYATLGDDAVVHGLNETEVKYVITSHDLLPKFKNILNKTPNVHTVIYFQDQLQKTETKDGFKSDVKFSSYSEVLQLGKASATKNGFHRPTPRDIAIIMYTSGSTAAPKGVLLSHGNICFGMLGMADRLGGLRETDRYMAYLPLAHVLELMCETYVFLVGIQIGYSSPLTMTDRSSKIKRGCQGDASLLRPTIMATVPLILERVFKGIIEKVESGGKIPQRIFKYFFDYKLRWHARGYDTPLVNLIIFRRIRYLMGGKVRMMLTGGAPLAPETHEFVRNALCCCVLQGFGLTETCACATVQSETDMSTGRVGSPLTCCDIKLVNWEEGNFRVTDKPNPRGEVLVGGDNVSLGYYKLDEATKKEFFEENGRRWFRTGDIGEMCDDGVLKIIDRKKDLVKLQQGEYVSLGKVESELKSNPYVDNICIYGESTQLFVVALVVPVDKQLYDLAKTLGKPTDRTIEQLCEDSDLTKEVHKQLQEYGKKVKLDKFELPGALKLVPEKWTPDSGLVTAAFKLKRKNIQDKYQTQINELYAKK